MLTQITDIALDRTFLGLPITRRVVASPRCRYLKTTSCDRFAIAPSIVAVRSLSNHADIGVARPPEMNVNAETCTGPVHEIATAGDYSANLHERKISFE
jgi:hypothetical protein